jgi:hypothetical protein
MYARKKTYVKRYGGLTAAMTGSIEGRRKVNCPYGNSRSEKSLGWSESLSHIKAEGVLPPWKDASRSGYRRFRWRGRDLNPRHEAYESPALPSELPRQITSVLLPGEQVNSTQEAA